MFPPLGHKSRQWLGAGLLAALAAAIPFIVNDRIGVLGQGLVNDDMANHLLMADWAQNGTEPKPELITDGYPLGPHSLAATLSDLLGTGLVEAFAGLTLAIAAVAAITALAALDRLPPVRRTFAAALAALPYLGAAYLAQGAFKEPIQALLLVTMVLLLTTCGGIRPSRGHESPHVRLAIPIAVIAAATIYNYSFPGLFWLAAAAALYILLVPRPLDRLRTLAVPAIAAVAAAALLTLPEWGRILAFTGFGAFDPAGEQTGLGNLRQALSPLEALGVWPTGEFRLAPADASIPAAAFYLAGLLGAVAVGIGVAVALRDRREDHVGAALIAAFGSAAVIYIGAGIAGTPYTSAKALAITAVPAALLALRALLARGTAKGVAARVRPALAVAFVLAAAVSSFLALRQAPVSPPEHPDELESIRPAVARDPVLFLGRDDFIAWHLRGSPVSTHIKNFFSTGRVPTRADYPDDAELFGFDAVSAATLDRFPWVLTSSSGYAAGPPDNFELAESTPSYALYRRTGPTRSGEPRAEEHGRFTSLACDTTLESGDTASTQLDLEPGTWEVSLAYDSPRPIELSVTGPGLGGAELEVPANLDFRGPTPPFPARPNLEVERAGAYEVEVRMADPPLAGRLLGAEGEAHLRGVVAVGESGHAVAPCPA